MAGLMLILALMTITLDCADGINCPGNRDWYMRNDHCYLWKPSLTATWERALNICRAYRGTDLVYLDSLDEKDWLTTQVTEVFWTGLNDRATESVFQWTTNSSLDADLEPFLKNDLMNGDSKDCIEMDANTGQLMDRSCSEIKTFVCKSKKFMDWFLKEEKRGLISKPPYSYDSRPTLAEAKITCLQRGIACKAVLETDAPHVFYILHSSPILKHNPVSNIYIPSVCVSNFPASKCGFEDQLCDCTGVMQTSFTEVCGISVDACKNYCVTKKDGTDCGKCIPICPDDANEILKKGSTSLKSHFVASCLSHL
ncbi:C-type mannose receptor 2-like isoform X2 [Chiloscyllium plagiosum]|uniref:C-type mannose receptor 2-like isoform X2 n=1 Tax=Chiloscyllium plagiosum TaxID=36176 RepID=UPI001CB88906|nr:C-type mannose receptor 2-like isoform X2 [Chiloscyllium plagiosum]